MSTYREELTDKIISELPVDGFWVIVTRRPPTIVSPPRMSIHFARPDTVDKHVDRQQKQIDNGWLEPASDGTLAEYSPHVSRSGRVLASGSLTGTRDPDWSGAVSITYHGETIRLFPHEYNRLTSKAMQGYCVDWGVEYRHPDGRVDRQPSHQLIVTRGVDKQVLRTALETDLKTCYDAALIDGCNPIQAFFVVMGVDPGQPEFEFPPVGWYRLNRHLAEQLFYEIDYLEDEYDDQSL